MSLDIDQRAAREEQRALLVFAKDHGGQIDADLALAFFDRAERAEAALAAERRCADEMAAALEKDLKCAGAWIIGGDDTANMNGFIDAMCSQGGEFNVPLYEMHHSARALAAHRARRSELDASGGALGAPARISQEEKLARGQALADARRREAEARAPAGKTEGRGDG